MLCRSLDSPPELGIDQRGGLYCHTNTRLSLASSKWNVCLASAVALALQSGHVLSAHAHNYSICRLRSSTTAPSPQICRWSERDSLYYQANLQWLYFGFWIKLLYAGLALTSTTRNSAPLSKVLLLQGESATAKIIIATTYMTLKLLVIIKLQQSIKYSYVKRNYYVSFNAGLG